MEENKVTAQLTEDEIITLKKLLTFSKSLIESMNTGIIANLTQTMTTLGVLVDTVNNPEMKKMIYELSSNTDELTEMINKLTDMYKDGTIDALVDLSNFIVSIKNSMTPEIILKMTHLIPEPKTISMLEKTLEATKEIKEQMDKEPPKVGVGSLLKAMKDPEVQYLLGYGILLSKRMANIIKE